jgi:hypothetical protein
MDNLLKAWWGHNAKRLFWFMHKIHTHARTCFLESSAPQSRGLPFLLGGWYTLESRSLECTSVFRTRGPNARVGNLKLWACCSMMSASCATVTSLLTLLPVQSQNSYGRPKGITAVHSTLLRNFSGPLGGPHKQHKCLRALWTFITSHAPAGYFLFTVHAKASVALYGEFSASATYSHFKIIFYWPWIYGVERMCARCFACKPSKFPNRHLLSSERSPPSLCSC